MSDINNRKLKKGIAIVLFFFVFIFVLFVNGAIPFYAVPTFGQATWATGFAQSFINDSVFNIFAHNIGIPRPAAISFGLAGAWPIGLLIGFGLHPADAYSCIAALWLGVAYFSAYKISCFFGVKSINATLLAALWLTMPTVWAHSGYSMLSWGIALLSFYYYRAVKLLLNESPFNLKTVYYISFYFFSVVISVFMDGYSFMMFAVGTSFLIVYIYFFMSEYRRNLLFIGIPTHIVSFTSAYLLYIFYIGKSSFDLTSIDFFRSWGLDLSFIIIPTKGMLWLFDILGLSTKRVDESYFGDASVWLTTFALPIILVGVFSWYSGRKLTKLASGILIIAFFSFYMSLGPSLKINSTKPVEMLQVTPTYTMGAMPAELAIMPTGNAWISENLPGFNAMRAPYRWSALGIFACWLLLSLYIGKRKRQNDTIVVSVIIILIFSNIPNLQSSWDRYRLHRTLFMKLDSDLLSPLKKEVSNNEVVAFIPYYNDFVINYLASKLNVRTYNIGGDKNLVEAKKEWPDTMLDSGVNVDGKVIKLLLNAEASTIVIPYFDTYLPSRIWPRKDIENPTSTTVDLRFKYPKQIKNDFKPLIKKLKSLPYLLVNDKELFATIKINPDFLANKSLIELKNEIRTKNINNIDYPVIISPQLENSEFILENWNSLESAGVWSKDISVLNLPVPNRCQNVQCTIVLNFGVIFASETNPFIMNMKLSTQDKSLLWHETLTLVEPTSNEVSIPLSLPLNSDIVSITIEALGATSPQRLGLNDDMRTLGIFLNKITLKEE
ncbi:Uncharacterised protein [Yersinia frederiksenii]|uniref:hypothetical protein n=1 Tax=Yersinia frederiksenii TaxID=29484 RepID=UPI0005DD6C47|nr:hypothetical protein [Yersinia frederiksenii]CNB48723.1 Uncharacterised protein [Yersinia frederiksenii]